MTKIKDAVVLAGKGSRFGKGLVCGMLAAAFLFSFDLKAEQSGANSVSINRIPSQYKAYAVALGQRLVKAGKERITISGFLTFEETRPQNAIPLRITWQYPLKVKIEQGPSTWTVDIRNPQQKLPELKAASGLIRMLLEDTTEGFFGIEESEGYSHLLGTGFRLEAAKASDPGVDVIQIIYPDAFQKGRDIAKSYWFNGETKLLGLVGYTDSSGATVNVIFEDWRDIQGERIPFSIKRLENGNVTMNLTVSEATVTAGAEDGTFGGN
jgi:hypothetical protein